jgi:UDP-glucose 4-epimerase
VKKTLLIGGAGYIGSHLKNSLLERGYEVAILCRKMPDIQDTDVEYLVYPMDDMAALAEILPQCSHVIHLASATTPGTSAQEPSTEVINNILPTLRFLEVLQQHQHIHLIFISSGGAIYGDIGEEFVGESNILQPLSYYGASKVTIETFLHAFQQQTTNKITILRPSNIYGPNQPLKLHFGIVPTIFNHLINSSVLEIWGDGETIRDYLYIDDFIALCLSVLQAADDSKGYRVFNAGSGHGYAINQICNLVESITGKTIKRTYAESRRVDVKRIVLDSGYAELEFEWKASTSIEQGLQNTWDYYLASD